MVTPLSSACAFTLLNSAVDAAFLVEPFITLGEQRGVSQCWRPTSELTPDLQIAIGDGDPTLGYDTRLHDGAAHTYFAFRRTAELFAVFTAVASALHRP